MIAIDDKLISDDVYQKQFACDLSACKGACCVEGESGAPLELDELPVFDDIYPKIADLLTEKGRAAIEEQGLYVLDEKDGTFKTPLVDGAACAYVVYEGEYTFCGIEKAQRAGLIDYLKPISCHLYPIRVTQYDGYQAVNYETWDICAPACDNGCKLELPVYQFLKAPLIRKYGEDFFDTLHATVQMIESGEE